MVGNYTPPETPYKRKETWRTLEQYPIESDSVGTDSMGKNSIGRRKVVILNINVNQYVNFVFIHY